MSIRLVLLLAALSVGLLLWARAHRPGRRLPRHRVLHMRIRLRLRLRPGPGHASLFQLWLRWGRFASYRESKRTRPSLTRWDRFRHPALHSVRIGWAQLRHALRVPVQEHGCLIGPPRMFKSALLSSLVLNAPGAVVTTSSKPDIFRRTSLVRSRRGPVWVFNPLGLGGIPSNVRWDVLSGCATAATAIRRADGFARAASTSGAQDAEFWAGKASDALRAMFMSAARGGGDIRLVNRWASGGSALKTAVEILQSVGLDEWAGQLAELTGPAEKTAATVLMVISRALGWLNDPDLAAAALPAGGEGFDIDQFLLEGGTLYCLARVDGDGDSVLAPLFAALISEIEFRATQLGASMPEGRMDPPLLLALDEVTQIAPVPLPGWLADAGGQGVSIWSCFHGVAQLRARWKEHGAQTILDTSNVKVFMPGLADPDTLEHASRLAGQAAYLEHGEEKHSRHDVLTPDMIRQLPAGWALAQRGNHAPVLFRVAKGWQDRTYRRTRRWAKRNDLPQEAVIVPPAAAATFPRLQVPAGVPDLEQERDLLPELQPMGAPVGDYPWSGGDAR